MDKKMGKVYKRFIWVIVMSILYKVLPSFLDDITTKYVYHYFKKNEYGLMDCIAFMKTKELESLTKKTLIPYTCKLNIYNKNNNLINKSKQDIAYTVYIQIYDDSKDKNKTYIIHPETNEKIYISLNPGDAIIIDKNIHYGRNLFTGYILELEYINAIDILLHNNYNKCTYKNNIDIELTDFWKIDTWDSQTINLDSKLKNPDIYSINDFPSISYLNSTLMDEFIKEANDVFNVITTDNTIVRKRNEWDNINTVTNLKDAIRYNNNSKWIVAQYNKDWLNYPLIYYDESFGGMADELCPSILKYLKKCKNIRIAGLSLLKKGGIIDPHIDTTGRSKDALACHIGLIGKGLLNVNDKIIVQEPKKIIIFDSEHKHSAKNPYNEDRIILYIDFIYSKHYKPNKTIKVNIYSRCE